MIRIRMEDNSDAYGLESSCVMFIVKVSKRWLF